MTDQQHPITPPPELVQQWASESLATQNLCNRAAQWGADQELEACCEWLAIHFAGVEKILRTVRRPKPPSLKEQALMALEDGDTGPGASLTLTEVSIIRRALEALPND